MNSKTPYHLSWLGLALLAATPVHAVSLLQSTDVTYAIDLDLDSNPGGGEGAAQGIDGNSATKYLNLGAYNSGLIYSGISSSTFQSMVITTANDHVERDPTSYLILGTNSTTFTPATTTAVSDGWTFVTSGTLSLSDTRFTSSTVNVTGVSGYSSYWLVFPTLKATTTPNSMSIADVLLYTGTGGTGAAVTGTTTTATSWGGSFPANEAPSKAFDGTTTKYLNFGKENSGFVAIPSVGLTVLQSFTLTSANDSSERDPASYTLYGQSVAGAWNIIQSGTLSATEMPSDRLTVGSSIAVTNTTAYKAYAWVANTLRNGTSASSMQIGEVSLQGTVVPEPAPALLSVAGGLVGLLGLRRRRIG